MILALSVCVFLYRKLAAVEMFSIKKKKSLKNERAGLGSIS